MYFQEEDALIIGSRNNTESIILSNLMGQLIEEKTDINVHIKKISVVPTSFGMP